MITIFFIFLFVSPYKNRCFNLLDSLGVTVAILRVCVLFRYRDVLNIIIGVFLIMYFCVFISCKIILKLNRRCSRKLKELADKLSRNRTIARIEREPVGMEDSLPDRVLNPEGYRRLHNTLEEPCDPEQLNNNFRRIPTYGII